MRAAQALLADAYLESGRATEARAVAEELLAADPNSVVHAQRLRRALQALGVEDVEKIVEGFLPPEGGSHTSPVASGFSRTTPAPEVIEVDLSDALSALLEAPGPPPSARPLEAVFEELRKRAAQEAAAAGSEQYFGAAAALGRLHIEQGDLQAGVEWLERAAQALAPSAEDSHALLYDLADALERLGQPGRALAVLTALGAEAGDYRDVRARVDQLSRGERA
jgi:tetratricopeptide (TPR) repeat protein